MPKEIHKPTNFVILASGTGTNARALMEHALKRPEKIVVQALISDREAPVLKIAEELKIPHFIIDHRNEGPLMAILNRYEPHWACLAGYKRIVQKNFLDFFWDKSQNYSRVMNVHPSLLPAYTGLNGYERAFKDGVKVSGVTVHLVDGGLDTGKHILQESFDRKDNDRVEDFCSRGHKIEHRLYTKAMDFAAAGKIRLVNKDGSIFVSTE